jgi:hypothetical protein
MCITLDNIQLFQDVDQNNDPTLSNPMERNFVHWQNNPLACPMTVAAASLVSAEAEPALVRLAWQIEMESATLQRRARGAAWTDLARLFPDGSHRVRYEDRDVSPGVTYGYRLRVPVPAGEVYAGETEVTVPAATELALGAPSWDRTASRLGFALTLPRAGTASIEIFDVSGRRWTTRRLEGLAAGSHEVGVDIPLGLASGVYFARLTHASAAVTRSFVLTR